MTKLWKLLLLCFCFGQASSLLSILQGRERRHRASTHYTSLLVRPIVHQMIRNLSILDMTKLSSESEPELVLVDDQKEQDLPDDVLADLEAGQPSELTVMKEVR
jgi:hypothetical protein